VHDLDSLKLSGPEKLGASSRLSVAHLLFFALAIFYVGLVVSLAGWRDLPGYETETDFVGGMVWEARQLLAGEPLESEFHPPGFVLVLAGTYAIVGGWFAAGKLIATVAGTVALIASFLLFRGLGGAWAGLGAVIGLVSSYPFMTYSIQATSDVYFLALFSLAGLAAWAASARQEPFLWVLAGALVGLCVMTRTNGITQLVLLAIPLFRPGSVRSRLSGSAAAAAGLLAVLAGFLAFAWATGSNLLPTGTVSNLAMNYFTEEKISWEGVLEAQARFGSLTDVLLYDPGTLLRSYLGDLYHNTTGEIVRLGGPFLALVFLPGLIFLTCDRLSTVILVFLLATAAQVLLINLKAYEARYYLFLVPWIGAGAGYLALRLAQSDWPKRVRVAAAGVVVGLMLASLALAVQNTVDYARQSNPELSAALPDLRAHVSPQDTIVARKPHAAFETDANSQWLPEIDTLPELEALLAATAAESEGEVFLFYGRIERLMRPQLEPLISGAARPDWLGTVASGDLPEPWTFYRYQP
jgi:Dolichyl-phosphate-mannose-protein mannosyltransferase